MTAHKHLQLLNALSAHTMLTKCASVTTDADAQAALEWMPEAVLSDMMATLKTASASPQPHDIIDFILTVRDAQAREGVKLAADSDLLQVSVIKLAAALTADDALTRELDAASTVEAIKLATDTRNLGREYIAHLTSLLLA